MGIAGAGGLFASIVFHELCHSLVARRFGLQMKGITLFVFGGVAEMAMEPPSAKVEFMVAIIGPISSVVMAGMLFGAWAGLSAVEIPKQWGAVMHWLGSINLVLAGFNLVPGFPLDGGRILRSILWAWKNDLRWATKVASAVGRGFGTALILIGVFMVVWGNFVGGLWMALIGMFIRFAADQGYRQLLVRQLLGGEKVRRFMTANPISVDAELPVDRLVEDFFYRHHHKLFPVLDGEGRLVGCVTTRDLRHVPREQWPGLTAGQIAGECSPDNTVSADLDALAAMGRMTHGPSSRFMVVEQGRLVGLVTLRDLMKFLSLKMELEGASNQ